MPLINLTTAVEIVNNAGIVLVFPIKGKQQIPSLWKAYFPRKEMSWDWSSSGSAAVGMLWHLRTELATSDQVIYSKWFQGRATLFSKKVFSALLAIVSQQTDPLAGLRPESRILYRILLEDSPLPTKRLKQLFYEETEPTCSFDSAIRTLWTRLLIVGYGEVEEGGFPSLAVGATRLLFEDLWDASVELTTTKRDSIIGSTINDGSPFKGGYLQLLRQFSV